MSRWGCSLNAAIGQSRHPKFGLVLAVFQAFSNTRASCLFNQRQIDHRAGIRVIIEQLPLVGAATSRDLAEEALSDSTYAICRAGR